MFDHEESPAQIDHGRHAERPPLVDLDGHVETGHGGQLEKPLVHGTDREVSIQKRDGDADDFTAKVEVIYHLVRPLADLLPP